MSYQICQDCDKFIVLSLVSEPKDIEVNLINLLQLIFRFSAEMKHLNDNFLRKSPLNSPFQTLLESLLIQVGFIPFRRTWVLFHFVLFVPVCLVVGYAFLIFLNYAFFVFNIININAIIEGSF